MSEIFHLREMPKLPVNKNLDLEQENEFVLDAAILEARIKKEELINERNHLIDNWIGRKFF